MPLSLNSPCPIWIADERCKHPSKPKIRSVPGKANEESLRAITEKRSFSDDPLASKMRTTTSRQGVASRDTLKHTLHWARPTPLKEALPNGTQPAILNRGLEHRLVPRDVKALFVEQRP